MVEVARRSPIPVATGESLTSLGQFADLLAHDAVHILQPEPLNLGGLWRTRQVAAMADAHYAVVAPHNAQGPVCGAMSRQLGACIPNFYVQESFDEFGETLAMLCEFSYRGRDGTALRLRGDRQGVAPRGHHAGGRG